MDLLFKKNFAPLILDGTKIHTIRRGGWKEGDAIDFCTETETETPKHDYFKKGLCMSIQRIDIEYSSDRSEVEVYIDDYSKDWDEITLLAKNDGFNSVEDFFKYFNEDYEGIIIHWTKFKYPK